MGSLNYTNPASGSPVAVTVLSDATNAQVMRLDIGTGTAISAFTGAVTVSSGTVAATQSGTWNVGTVTTITNPVAVTGTFWQTTQPVSIAGNQAVNQVQVGGVAVNMGTGQVATGTQRIALGVGTPTITVVNSSITTGGTAQNAIAANSARLACMVQNTHATAILTVNEGGTASATAGILLNPGVGYEYPVGSMPVGAISVWSSTTGATYTVRHA